MDFDGYCNLSSDDEDDDMICVSHHYSSDESDSDNDAQLDDRLLEAVRRGCHTERPDDPFEEEMANELDRTMMRLRAMEAPISGGSNLRAIGVSPEMGKAAAGMGTSRDSGAQGGIAAGAGGSAAGAGAASSPSGGTEKQQYDKIYFDSDEDEEEEGVRRQRSTVSDADLLYDPTLDDRDQQWMDEHRAPHARSSKSQRGKKSSAGNSLSDAVLNCPGCLTMLCTDCQRHEKYSTQYRAMFVFSCRVDYTELLSFPTRLTKKEIFKNKKKERQLRRRNAKQWYHGTAYAAPVDTEALTGEDDDDSRSGHSETPATVDDGASGSEAMDCQEGNGKDSTEVKTHETNIAQTEEINGNDCPGKEQIIAQTPSTGVTIVVNPPKTSLSHKRTASDAENSSPVKKVRFADDTKPNAAAGEAAAVAASAGSCINDTGGAAAMPSTSSAALLQAQTEEMFHPVMCQHCNTKVAVLDREEIYHFFNVITSY